MLQCHQQGIAEEGNQYVRFHPPLQLMEEWANCQLTLEGTECGFHFGQLDVLFPKLRWRASRQIRA